MAQKARVLISVDPGLATGYAMGYYSKDAPYELTYVTTFHDGVAGVSKDYRDNAARWGRPSQDLVLENFIVRPHQPVDPVALEVIGYIKGVTEANLHMRLPSDKGKAGYMDRILKRHGLWQTGKMVDHTDGRDANDAIIHALTWLAFHEKHGPTLRKYFGEE